MHAVCNVELLPRPPLELLPTVRECHHQRVRLGPAIAVTLLYAVCVGPGAHNVHHTTPQDSWCGRQHQRDRQGIHSYVEVQIRCLSAKGMQCDQTMVPALSLSSGIVANRIQELNHITAGKYVLTQKHAVHGRCLCRMPRGSGRRSSHAARDVNGRLDLHAGRGRCRLADVEDADAAVGELDDGACAGRRDDLAHAGRV